MGSIWSPYAVILQEKSPAALQFIFGFGALLGVLGTYFLPETHNRSLPNNVNDLKELDAQTKRWRKVRVNVITDKTMLVDPENDVELDTGIYNPGFAGDNAGYAKDNTGYAKDSTRHTGYAKDNAGYAGSALPDVETV